MSSADRPRRLWPFLVALGVAVVVLSIVAAVLTRPYLGFPVAGPDGGDGVGDNYFPTAGGGGYDARDYRIDLSYDEPTRSLSGTTTMSAVASRDLASLHLDLDLGVTKAEVNGIGVPFEQAGRDVHVRSSRLLEAGRTFTVTLHYAGSPLDASDGKVPARDREIVIAGEPFSASYWFGSNDHPSDPARMELTIRVPADLQALSGGTLVSRDIADEVDFDTWHWRSDQPMATYLNFLSIGPYEIEEGTADGRPYLYAVSRQLSPARQEQAFAALRATPGYLAELEEIWGIYPFPEIGGVVPSTPFAWGALENQPRPIYHARSLEEDSQRLIVHEYAHMWFGNNVTLAGWDDIVMNEAYASYSEWLVLERRGEVSADEIMRRFYEELPESTWRTPIDDPGPDAMFKNVYTRGPMALHALRRLMGDDDFFTLSLIWANEPGSRSLEDWQARAREHSDVDLDRYFAVWFSATSKPEPTPENGF
ncbi:M1 family metallopeptidase [Ammonicoccus fulvus]|uniref:Aminopeptidase N n=1 Tax=Ammonicoccus fulvus TaxID=3138240 RepID=A0ABZ3FQV6_9ACTN